jgi:hypothetical protein
MMCDKVIELAYRLAPRYRCAVAGAPGDTLGVVIQTLLTG